MLSRAKSFQGWRFMNVMYLRNNFYHLHLRSCFPKMFTKHLQLTNALHFNVEHIYLIYLINYVCTLILFAGIWAFFRDLSSCTLTEDVIRKLDENIPILMCNLEKKLPSSFFDVMGTSSCPPPVWGVVDMFIMEGCIFRAIHETFQRESKKSCKSVRFNSCWEFEWGNISLHVVLLWVTSPYTKKGSNQIWWWWCYAEIYCWICSRHILSDWISKWETIRSLVVEYRRCSQCPLGVGTLPDTRSYTRTRSENPEPKSKMK